MIDETAVARSRTKSVSVYLKFAAENLRRRLYSKRSGDKNKNQLVNSENKSWIEVGKNFDTYEYDEQGKVIPKTLSETQRQETVEMLMELRSWDAPLEESEKFYTPEDWEWLMDNLPSQQSENKGES